MKVATILPEGSLWDKALRRMGAEWKQATDGRVSIKLYPGGVAGDELAIVKKMRIGQLQGAMLSASGLGEVDPALRVFESPLFFESDAEVQYVLGQVGDQLRERLADHGLVLIHWATAGWLRIFSVRPVENFEDYSRMKHFVWGTESRMGTWFQEVGLKPVPLASTDVMPGLQTGLIDALTVTPLAALSLQWFRSAPYMVENRFTPLIGGTVLSERAWKKIKPEDQETILRIARDTETFLFQEVPESEDEAIVEMGRRGLSFTNMTDAADLQKWNGLAKHLGDRLREHTVPREIFDKVTVSVTDYRKQQGESD